MTLDKEFEGKYLKAKQREAWVFFWVKCLAFVLGVKHDIRCLQLGVTMSKDSYSLFQVIMSFDTEVEQRE